MAIAGDRQGHSGAIESERVQTEPAWADRTNFRDLKSPGPGLTLERTLVAWSDGKKKFIVFSACQCEYAWIHIVFVGILSTSWRNRELVEFDFGANLAFLANMTEVTGKPIGYINRSGGQFFLIEPEAFPDSGSWVPMSVYQKIPVDSGQRGSLSGGTATC